MKFKRLLAKLRLYSGLVVILFVVSHLSHHAMGIIGIENAEQARRTIISFWKLPVHVWYEDLFMKKESEDQVPKTESKPSTTVTSLSDSTATISTSTKADATSLSSSTIIDASISSGVTEINNVSEALNESVRSSSGTNAAITTTTNKTTSTIQAKTEVEKAKVPAFLVFLASILKWVMPLTIFLHMVTSLYFVLTRKSLRMGGLDLFRIVVGLIIPFGLIGHFVSTRMVATAFGTHISYLHLLMGGQVYYYVDIVMIVVVWLHGTIGLHLWLKQKQWYQKIKSVLLLPAVILPMLAIFGALLIEKNMPEYSEALELSAKQEEKKANYEKGIEAMKPYNYALTGGWMGFIIVSLVVRGFVLKAIKRKASIKIHYSNGQEVRIPNFTTILEASRMAAIPHASICGGRGRCSTCRIRVISGMENLQPPKESEKVVLERIGADPNVRLACQSVPNKDVEIHLIIPKDQAKVSDGFQKQAIVQGKERDMVILFSDLRGFTQFSENKFPYDVVFILNEYFHQMGDAIERNGGHIDKFIGDGIMALFGLESSKEEACRNAVNAAKDMMKEMEFLNERFKIYLESPLKIGIGLHGGQAIVGEMGYKHATNLTAIGDVVNTASRLETSNKEFGSMLVISDYVVSHAGIDTSSLEAHSLQVRGKSNEMKVYSAKSRNEISFLTRVT